MGVLGGCCRGKSGGEEAGRALDWPPRPANWPLPSCSAQGPNQGEGARGAQCAPREGDESSGAARGGVASDEGYRMLSAEG